MRLRLLKKETVVKMRFSVKDFDSLGEAFDVLRKRYPNYRLGHCGPKSIGHLRADVTTQIVNIEVPVE